MKLTRIRNGVLTAALALFTLTAAGCMAAAAGVGAAAAVHMTGNSAQSQVPADIATVDARARAVLSEMGVQVEARTETQGGVEYRGTAGNRDLTVELEAVDAGMTQVTASAQVSPVEWDNAYARDIVRRIADL